MQTAAYAGWVGYGLKPQKCKITGIQSYILLFFFSRLSITKKKIYAPHKC
jgi:hypothetical protein